MHVCPGQLCRPMKTQSKDKRVVQQGMSQRGPGSAVVPPKTVSQSLAPPHVPRSGVSLVPQHKGACFSLPSLAEGFAAVSSVLRQWPLAFNFSGAFQLSIFLLISLFSCHLLSSSVLVHLCLLHCFTVTWKGFIKEQV